MHQLPHSTYLCVTPALFKALYDCCLSLKLTLSICPWQLQRIKSLWSLWYSRKLLLFIMFGVSERAPPSHSKIIGGVLGLWADRLAVAPFLGRNCEVAVPAELLVRRDRVRSFDLRRCRQSHQFVLQLSIQVGIRFWLLESVDCWTVRLVSQGQDYLKNTASGVQSESLEYVEVLLLLFYGLHTASVLFNRVSYTSL